MLSRIADSLFWIARYMERAEDTARILDVNYHMLLEQPVTSYRLRWDQLVTITGEQERFFQCYQEADARNVFEFLAFRRDNPNSIVECVSNVRENARTIRDRISREMWEEVNGLYHTVSRFLPEEEMNVGPHRFCNLIKFGSHRLHGVSDDTLPHDEGWQFLQAGRALERAEMTARIVDLEYQKLVEGPETAGAPDNHQWMAVLLSVAAYESYRRQYHSRIEPQRVAELLILHPLHPRSIRFNVGVVQQSLRAISAGGSSAGPEAYANEAERLTGKLHESLMYDRIEDIFSRGLHRFLVDLQKTCRAIGEQIARTYFYYGVVA
ncbi:MAG TPA: alpha-E domain-containing protein [Bryobacteraceae bacterium]|nr:alpha-E domain-containing protein [Bryobacteraceae bacterium]